MEFKPTWLYVKQHNISGLRYFGKTSQSNVEKYKGSGRYWKNHIRQHGNDVTTIWSMLFLTEDDLVEFAQFFTEFYDIVKSTNLSNKKIWANLVPEDGRMGGQNIGMPSPMLGKKTGRLGVWNGKKRPAHSEMMTGRVQTEEHSNKISLALTGRQRTVEHGNNISIANKGKPKPRVSQALKGRILPKTPCKYCRRLLDAGNMKLHHGEKCKHKDEENNNDKTN
jgi:hypothetical protein